MKSPAEQDGSSKRGKGIHNLRVVREAEDIFWGAFSGSTKHIVVRVLLHSLLMFLAAAGMFELLGARVFYNACYNAPRVGYPENCWRPSFASFLPFAPSLCMLIAGSFISTRLCSEKIFQTSAFNTVFMLFLCWLALSRLGLGGGFQVLLLIGVFFCMFLGYKAAFLKVFAGNSNP